MDEVRVDSVSPYDPVADRQGEDLRKRKRKPRPDPDESEIEDVVSFSERLAEEEGAGGGTDSYFFTSRPYSRSSLPWGECRRMK